MPQIHIYSRADWRMPLSRRELATCLKRMLAALPEDMPRPAGIDLHCLRDGHMAPENAAYMGCPGPTNVLSFPGGEDMPGTLLFSVDTLYRESLLYGQSPLGYTVRLLAHGVGHLLGLDHGPAMDAVCALMEEAAVTR